MDEKVEKVRSTLIRSAGFIENVHGSGNYAHCVLGMEKTPLHLFGHLPVEWLALKPPKISVDLECWAS